MGWTAFEIVITIISIFNLCLVFGDLITWIYDRRQDQNQTVSDVEAPDNAIAQELFPLPDPSSSLSK